VGLTYFANLFAVLYFSLFACHKDVTFFSDLITRRYTAPTRVLNSLVKENTSTKVCMFAKQTQNTLCCILSRIGLFQCDP
jgi:hypothetical protein